MKKSILIVVLAVSTASVFTACNNSKPKSNTVESTTAEKVVYTCPMHPEVTSDKPGSCPKCGMDLVKQVTPSSDTMHIQPGDTMKMK
jgi:hypothetical protein